MASQLDHGEHEELPAGGVPDAARLLAVSEFDLFRLAYRRWHGRHADVKQLETVFTNYLFYQDIPPWVRHLVRQVLADAQAGRLDRTAYGADEVPRREPLVDYPRRFIALAMVGAILMYLLILALIG